MSNLVSMSVNFVVICSTNSIYNKLRCLDPPMAIPPRSSIEPKRIVSMLWPPISASFRSLQEVHWKSKTIVPGDWTTLICAALKDKNTRCVRSMSQGHFARSSAHPIETRVRIFYDLKKGLCWRFRDLRLKNEFEDRIHHQEAYARNDHVRQLQLLQDRSRARRKSTSVHYLNNIERLRDRTRKDASEYFTQSNIHSTGIEVNVLSCMVWEGYLPWESSHVDQSMWFVFCGRVVDSVCKE